MKAMGSHEYTILLYLESLLADGAEIPVDVLKVAV